MEDIYYIYAFIDKKGKIAYVGKTINLKTREAWHRGATKSKIRKYIKGYKFKILRKTNFDNVYRIEHQIIKSLKNKCQAWLNIKLGTPLKKKTEGWYSHCILWKERGMKFNSFAAVKRFFKYEFSPYTLSLHLKNGEVKIDQETTLKLI